MQEYTLEAARAYEAKYAAFIAPEDRPTFHLTPMVGWMNDPNGFSFYNGQFHLFYQYHPYGLAWGPMHWGHAVSHDLIRWEYLPVALAPDSQADGFGCFSGSALTLPDGRHLLMYTGVRQEKGEDGLDIAFQTQCLAVGNGVTYEKHPLNPVLGEKDLPQGYNLEDFRDPKVWQESDGTYHCVAGARNEDGSGAILLFGSPDGFSWHFENILDRSYNEIGKMWECPDFFPLDGKQVLLISPQDMNALGYEFHSGNNVAALIGDYDRETHAFTRQNIQAIDYGLDFYAPQTALAPDGRRIMVAWMQNWDSLGGQPREQKWVGQMTLPREISLKNGRLIQQPIREIKAMHGRKVTYTNVSIHEETTLPGIFGRTVDMTLRIRPKEKGSYSLFRLKVARGSQHYTSLSYRPQSGLLHFSRRHAGFRRDFVHERQCQVERYAQELTLRVILDRFSVEIFVGEGEQTLTSVIYTPMTANGITFESDGEVLIDVEKYELKL